MIPTACRLAIARRIDCPPGAVVQRNSIPRWYSLDPSIRVHRTTRTLSVYSTPPKFRRTDAVVPSCSELVVATRQPELLMLTSCTGISRPSTATKSFDRRTKRMESTRRFPVVWASLPATRGWTGLPAEPPSSPSLADDAASIRRSRRAGCRGLLPSARCSPCR